MIARALNLFLAVLMTLPTVHADSSKAQKVDEQIELFVESLQGTEHVMILNPAELSKIYKDHDIESVLEAQIMRLSLVKDGPDDSLAKLDWSEERAGVKRRADEIARAILALPIEDINLTLLALLDRYLFDDMSRGSISYIIDALLRYRFNQDEIYRLQKEASWVHQYSNGTAFGILVIAGTALWTGRKGIPIVTKAIAAYFERTWGQLVKLGTKEAAKVAESQGGVPVDELLAALERSGLRSAVAKGAAKSLSGAQISQLSKIRLRAKLTNVLTPGQFKAFLALTGFSASTGAANVGLHAVVDKLFPENFNNTVIDFNDLQDNYYDRLAALRLSCLSHDLVERAKDAKTVDKLPGAEEIARIYTEFELLKTINMSLVDVRQLPREVTVDNDTGDVHFSILARGRTIEGKFACAKFKGESIQTPSVSLNEVLRDVMSVVERFSEFKEVEAKAKAAAQVPPDVTPDGPR